MTTCTYSAALTIQKIWRGYIFAKALPYALAQARSRKDMERKIHGPQWGDPPQDWELEGNRYGFGDDYPSDEEEEPCFDSENENLSWGDYDEDRNERQYYFH
jgi:hypothetical protein